VTGDAAGLGRVASKSPPATHFDAPPVPAKQGPGSLSGGRREHTGLQSKC